MKNNIYENRKRATHPIIRALDFAGDDNFPCGCAFSPDGLCVLTATAADNRLRLYNTPSQASTSRPQVWKTVLSSNAGDSVRGYAWYPLMNSYDPSTCIFVSAIRENPIHLIDAYDGSIRCSYRAYDDADAIEAASCVTFTPDGCRIVAGFERCVKVFHTGIPGKDCDVWRLGKSKRSSDGQKGIVSALSCRNFERQDGNNNVFAVGTYAGSIYLYDDRFASGGNPSGTIVSGMCVVGQGKNYLKKRKIVSSYDGGYERDSDEDESIFSSAKLKWFQKSCKAGITQLQFAPDGLRLYSAGRKCDSVVSWDIRMLSDPSAGPVRGLASYGRGDGDTNQRLEFDLDESGNRIFVGGTDRCVRIYDVLSTRLEGLIDELCDTANGVSVTKSVDRDLLAVAVGSRRFESFEEYDDADDDEDDVNKVEADKKGATDDLRPPGTLELFTV